MRVTTDMIFRQSLFNLSRNIDRYMGVQAQISTGRRINTPSDDPIGTQHDLNYRTRLEEMGQYLSNISQGTGWLSTYESGLADLKDLYSSAKEIAVTMANDTNNDEVIRQAAANEVQSLLEQVLQIANSKVDGRYMYSGHMTGVQTLESSANGVTYRGDRGVIDLEMDTGSRLTSNLIGEDVFLKQLHTLGADADLQTGVTADTLLADLNLGNGVDLSTGTFEIFDQNLGITYAIDLTGAVTVGDAVGMINAQLGPGSNLTLQIPEAGAALAWKPVVPNTNSIGLATPLANLNAGAGIDQQPGTFIIRNADSSINVTVDISDAQTISDVLIRINTTMMINGVSGFTAGFNADHTGLMLTDGNVPPLGLSIEESSDVQTTAADLGIIGRLDPSLVGADISPRIDFTIRDIGAQTTGADLGILGNIHGDNLGQNIRPQITLDTAISTLNNVTGFNLGELKISQGSQFAIIDLGDSDIVTVADMLNAINTCGLEITATINDARTGIQIEPTVTGKSLMIESNDSSNTARALGLAGSSDMVGSLMVMINALRNGDRELVEQLNGNMDLAMNELLSVRADVGAKMKHLDTTQNRIENAQVNVTKLLSDVEDADIVSLISRLAREENLYQAALVASSKMMQQSLVDFLR